MTDMQVKVQMMREFVIYAGNERVDYLAGKSPKGIALLQMLILKRGEAISSGKLIATLWSNENSTNPESALKTLVSRLRALLTQVSPALSRCLITERGGYRWQSEENVAVDVLEIFDLMEKIEDVGTSDDEKNSCCEQMILLFQGDLAVNGEFSEWAMPFATALHTRYMSAVKGYLARLKAVKDYDKVVSVCRSVLEVNRFEDELHIEMMNALMETNRPNDALQQYKHTIHLYYHYLGIQPSEAIQEFYKKITMSGNSLDVNLNSIQRELIDNSSANGAFVCEYPVFKDVYNLQARNFERLNIPIFLCLISVSFLDDVHNNVMYHATIMDDLVEILRRNLRKGDMVTRFSPTILAVLLPTVDYSSIRSIMERIKQVFYRKYPSAGILFDYRAGPVKPQKNDQGGIL